MISYVKNSSARCLKQKLTFIYFLNTIDIIFTYALLKTGLFQEVNVLMVNIVNDALLSILIKLILPAVLMIYIVTKLDELPFIHLPLCNFFVMIVFTLYSSIALMHLFYSLLFLYVFF